MDVLIVTRSDDNACIGMVSEELRRRGHRPIRLDTDLYPLRVRMSAEYGAGREVRHLVTSEGRFDLAEVGAVWYRRFAGGASLPVELGDTREPCLRESRQTLLGAIASLDCRQVDPLRAVREADFKELQTRRALALGMDCPRTLFTNDPAEALRFTAAQGEVITKMQSSFAVYRGGEEHVVFTNRVTAADLDHLEGLRYAPMMFQERVSKRLELRTIVVGERTFTAAVDSQKWEAAREDWRKQGLEMIDRWEAYALPAEVSRQVVALTRSFGLRYSAADFIVSPEGRHVFLEINAAGEWFWLQQCPGLPIAAALAEELTAPG